MLPNQVTDQMKAADKFMPMPKYMKENPNDVTESISNGSFVSDMSNLTDKEMELEREKE